MRQSDFVGPLTPEDIITSSNTEHLIYQIKDWLVDKGLSETLALYGVRIVGVIAMVVLAYWANFIAKRIIVRVIRHLITKSKYKWDDILIERKVFNKLSHLAPAVVIYWMAEFVFAGSAGAIQFTQTASLVYMVIAGLLVIDSLLNALVDIYRSFEFSHRLPIRSFVQVFKVLIYFALGISILSIVMGKNPTYFLGGMGAMTAVLMLIFKDSILGFVAGIQLSTNQMVRLGDWIEMPKYGADGDVIDISLTTVKVRNWDKTISTVPTYALISDSFKNWRGMSESGGRRIKRALYIDMTSIQFCPAEMLERFRKIEYITEYIDQKKREIAENNAATPSDQSELLNGRRLTNIGTFRAYVAAYLKNHPKIHQDMTFLVRQLSPTDHGLPLEIYVFSNDQAWANYEALQADIFDHLLAAIGRFDLKVFQNPTGTDFQKLKEPVKIITQNITPKSEPIPLKNKGPRHIKT